LHENGPTFLNLVKKRLFDITSARFTAVSAPPSEWFGPAVRHAVWLILAPHRPTAIGTNRGATIDTYGYVTVS
jgi:hypothetical protein